MTTSVKTCFKCEQEKPVDQFYRHPTMKDGRVNKCKKCNTFDVRENRKLKVTYYREYDRKRGNRQTKEDRAKYKNAWPEKYKAHCAVNNAVRDGRLKKEPCEKCGRTDVHGHHDDYNKPLSVRWLCPPCHSKQHNL